MGQIFDTSLKEKKNAPDIEIVFVVAVSIALGAGLRHLVAKTPLPYTVVVLLVGALVGIVNRLTAKDLYGEYGVFTRVNPHVLLHIFLPILIFESAFSMEVHTFFRSIWQVLLLAVPGVLLSTVMLATLAVLFFNYEWNWLEGMMFGSILSATDPVAVVALLRDLGASKQLTTLIEGESLLNDGSAIILFKVLLHILECNVHSGCTKTVPFLMQYFALVVVVGPMFGYITAKMALFCLSRIFNDAISEITITLATCYLAFYIGEEFLHVSGVIVVVVLGITMGGEHTSISPEVVEFLHRFWEVLVYIANTLIFTIVGMVIGHNIKLLSDRLDWFYLLAVYIGLNVIRMAVLAIFMPILRKMGYGLSVSEMMVVVWGGLRGAVGLSLALVVVENQMLRNSYNQKVMMLVCGIVILTLVINATTIKILLRILGMTDISVARRIAMTNALNYLEQIRDKTLESLKNDRFLADASWKHVEISTKIDNPYKTDDKADDLQMQEFRDLVDKDVVSKKEISEMGYEALLRMVKAEKYSYRRQFESGMLSAEGLHKLQECSEVAIDKKGYIAVSDICATWEVPQRLTKLKKKLVNMRKSTNVRPLDQADSEKNQIETFVDSLLYCVVFNLLLLASFIETGVGLAAQLLSHSNMLVRVNIDYFYYFQMMNAFFVIIFTTDIILKMYIFGRKFYFFGTGKTFYSWHIFKAVILIVGICDAITHFARRPQPVVGDAKNDIDQALLAFKLMRFVRLAIFLAAVLPLMLNFADKLINQRFRIGYDVARGFYRGKEDVIKIIDHIIDNTDIADKIRTRAMNHQFDVIKGIGILQRMHPAIALGVKTRQATRTVLNNLRDGISRLQEEGMLDTKEHAKLKNLIETKMKLLNLQTASIKPPPMEEVLGSIPWLQGNSELLTFIVKRAQRKSFCCNDVIKDLHSRMMGIYVIVSGMVLIESKRVDEDDFASDYKSSGVLGEFNFLSRMAPMEIYTADTDVQVYHLPYESLMKMVQIFDSQECPIIQRMWMAIAVPLAEKMLHTQDRYVMSSLDEIKLMLTTHAYIADTDNLDTFEITPDMADVILIVGTAYGMANEITYVGPSYIPWSAVKLQLKIGKDVRDIDEVVVILVLPWQPNDLKVKSSSQASVSSDTRLKSLRKKPNISFGALTAAINFLGATKAAPSMSVIQEEMDKLHNRRGSSLPRSLTVSQAASRVPSSVEDLSQDDKSRRSIALPTIDQQNIV